jgi:mono/diheme cytochrome c family protein
MVLPIIVCRQEACILERAKEKFTVFRSKSRLACICLLILTFSACEVERRKSDAELGLNAQQAAGRRVYDQYCDRCHEPYSSRSKQAQSLKGIFRKPYLPISGLPANDDRVKEVTLYGRSKMQGFSQVLDQQQVQDLLAYLHTL